MGKSGIYKITNTVTGKIYVGKSVDLKQRWHSHKSYLRSGTHCNEYLQRSWDKYGEESFVFEIIEYCPVENIEQREIYWINTLDSYKNGYNLTIGGEGCVGRIPTQEHRERLRQSNIGKQCRCGWKHTEEAKTKISQRAKGRILSEEHKQILFASRKGKPISEEHKQQIREYRTGQKYTQKQKEKMGKLHQGELNGTAILTDASVKEIRTLLKSTCLLSKEIAEMFNVSPQTISFIKNNKTWRHIIV